jgi:predicted metal-binding membrane protein
MMVMPNKAVCAALLLLAGLYQFTPFKTACMETCRRSQGPGSGRSGSSPPATIGFAIGVANGFSCAGCGWAFMPLLFVGGAIIARAAGGLILGFSCWYFYLAIAKPA